jgi:hypothetical protein
MTVNPEQSGIVCENYCGAAWHRECIDHQLAILYFRSEKTDRFLIVDLYKLDITHTFEALRQPLLLVFREMGAFVNYDASWQTQSCVKK